MGPVGSKEDPASPAERAAEAMQRDGAGIEMWGFERDAYTTWRGRVTVDDRALDRHAGPSEQERRDAAAAYVRRVFKSVQSVRVLEADTVNGAFTMRVELVRVPRAVW